MRRRAARRLAASTVMAIVVLALVDVALGFVAWRFVQRRGTARASLEASREWPGSPPPAEPDRVALTALVRQQALSDRALNLSVSVQHGTMALQRKGAQLRRMKVVAGPAARVGAGPHELRIERPRGRRRLVRIVDEDFVWSAPAWVYRHRGLAAPGPSARDVPGGLGPLALVLDDGTLIYSLPRQGPLSSPGYVMPGALLADASDLQAIRATLTPGLPVYFH